MCIRDRVEAALQGTDCNFSQFVIAAVRVALKNLEEDRLAEQRLSLIHIYNKCQSDQHRADGKDDAHNLLPHLAVEGFEEINDRAGDAVEERHHLCKEAADAFVVGPVSYTHLDVYKRQPSY